jgi:hypothetical protein
MDHLEVFYWTCTGQTFKDQEPNFVLHIENVTSIDRGSNETIRNCFDYDINENDIHTHCTNVIHV